MIRKRYKSFACPQPTTNASTMSIILLAFVLSCASADILSLEMERRVESLVNEQVAQLLLPYESVNQRITALEEEVKELRHQNILLKTKNIALVNMVETIRMDVNDLITKDRDFLVNNNSQDTHTNKSRSNIKSPKNISESSNQYVPAGQYTAEPITVFRRQNIAMTNFRNRRSGSFPGFMAEVARDIPAVADQTIVFSRVVTNSGSHYDSYSGVFTAPIEGLYAFFVTIQVQDTHYINFTIDKNGHSISHGQGSGTDEHFGTGTTVAVVHLVPGDHVWARCYSSSSGAEIDESQSNFAGFLI